MPAITLKTGRAPLDLHAMHTLYSGCTPAEKCELIERIWKLEEVVPGVYAKHDACEPCMIW